MKGKITFSFYGFSVLKIGIYQDYELNAAKLCSHVMELPQNAAIKLSAMYAYF